MRRIKVIPFKSALFIFTISTICLLYPLVFGKSSPSNVENSKIIKLMQKRLNLLGYHKFRVSLKGETCKIEIEKDVKGINPVELSRWLEIDYRPKIGIGLYVVKSHRTKNGVKENNKISKLVLGNLIPTNKEEQISSLIWILCDKSLDFYFDSLWQKRANIAIALLRNKSYLLGLDLNNSLINYDDIDYDKIFIGGCTDKTKLIVTIPIKKSKQSSLWERIKNASQQGLFLAHVFRGRVVGFGKVQVRDEQGMEFHSINYFIRKELLEEPLSLYVIHGVNRLPRKLNVIIR